MKVCSKCKIEKDYTEFSKIRKGHSSRCKDCANEYAKQYRSNPENKERAKEYKKEYYSNTENKEHQKEYYKKRRLNPEYKKAYKDYILKHYYNLTTEQYNEMLQKQDYKCAICGMHQDNAQKQTLCVDHDHETGDVRNLLCSRCNTAIGLLNDNSKIIQKASDYLFSHKPRFFGQSKLITVRKAPNYKKLTPNQEQEQ